MKAASKLRNNLKFKPLHLLIYAIILGIAGYIIIISRAAPVPPTVYLTPETRTLPANTTFTVAIRENSGTTPVNAVQANITYPANLLEIVGPVNYTGTAFPTEALNDISTVGEINIARSLSLGAAQPTGDQLIGTVTFKTKTTSGAAALKFVAGTALASGVNSQDLLPSLSATGGSTITVDATLPTATVTAPANNAVLTGGSTVSITTTASDNNGTVSSVGIYIDGALKTTLTSSPYNYSWNTAGVALGTHTIQARATDPYGNVGPSSVVTVTLADKTAPSVTLTAPSSGSTVKGNVTMTATASDNSGGTGVGKVEFFVDNVLVSTSTTAPYSYTWNSKLVSDGTHSLSAKAYDLASPANASANSTVSVNVENTDQQAPSTPGSLRTTSTSINSITLAWNASTDNVGVTGYRIQRNGTTIATVNALTYNDTGLTAGTSYNYTVVALDATSNASSAATLTASTAALKTGDIDSDGVVGVKDLAILLQNWDNPYAPADLNKNGKVDVFDLSMLLRGYNT